MITRRHFIQAGLLASTGSIVSGLALRNAKAATNPSDYKTLVHVYLDGGNDGFNMLVPTTTAEHQTYQRSRRELAFDKNQLLAISPDGHAANSFGLHPEMAGIQRLFNEGHASFITGMGAMEKPLTKTDILQGATLPPGLSGHGGNYARADHNNTTETVSQGGIGGRLAHEFNVPNAKLPLNITVGGHFELFNAHSTLNTYNADPSGLSSPLNYDLARGDFNQSQARPRAFRNANNAIIEQARGDENLLIQHYASLYGDGLELNVGLQQDFNQLEPITGNFTPSNSNAFKAAARLIAGRELLGMKRQVIAIQLGAFDTHADHLALHAGRLKLLDQDLTALTDVLVSLGLEDSVTIVTNSEFGRTLSSTGDGTDHAWANNQIIIGGAVKSKQLFGTYPTLELGGVDDLRDSGRLIPTTGTSQIFATIARWMGVAPNRIANVVPTIDNFSVKDLGFYQS